jgi:hypothetical protein
VTGLPRQAHTGGSGSKGDITKFLGAPFGLTLSSSDVNTFLLDKLDKKLTYWSTKKHNAVGREVISNGVLVSTMLYFLGIWSGTKVGIKQATSNVRIFFWSGTTNHSRARVAWHTCCLKRQDRGLNMVDPVDALTWLMAKWILSTLEPQMTNFKAILRYRLSLYRPHARGLWSPSLAWCLISSHIPSIGSKLWQ